MTRINCVPVQELCNKHLFAEWREMPRLQSYMNKSRAPMSSIVTPPQYILGAGHVKFFYNKLTYITNRYEELTKELLNRGYNIEPRHLVLSGPDFLWNDWQPTDEDMELNRQRIQDRLPDNPKYGRVNE